MKRIRISRVIVAVLLISGVFSKSIFAGNTSFSIYHLRDLNNKKVYTPISGCDNTKADEGVDWYFRTTYTYFSTTGYNLDGMAFIPMRSYSGIYGIAGDNAGWSDGNMSSVEYVSWGSGNGHAGVTYRLGARMDTDYGPSDYGDADGFWNAY